MNTEELAERSQILRTIIHDTGRQVERMRRETDLQVTIKDDGTPVTDADFWANDYLKQQISQHFPGELYIGEEENIQQYTTDASPIWYVDPIDGTKQFIDASAPYFILIGLVHKGEPILGLVYEPGKQRLIFGYKGGGAYLQWADTTPRPLHPETNWNTRRPLIIKGADRNFYAEFEKRTGIKRLGHVSDMHKGLTPLEARTQGWVSHKGLWIWDYCAPAAVMAAAGFQWGAYRNGAPVALNYGESFVDRCFILPEDTPEHIKQFLLG